MNMGITATALYVNIKEGEKLRNMLSIVNNISGLDWLTWVHTHRFGHSA